MIGNKIKYFNERLEDDLIHILEHTKDIWKNFKFKTIFITGGTGFFGKWFLEIFSYANLKLELNCRIIILSRNPDKFLDEFPYFGNNTLFKFIKGDVRNFGFPKEEIDYIIHAATEASNKLNNENPLLMFDTIVEGTRNVLNLAKGKKVKAFLLTSSGAVYGKQPSELTHIPEDYMGAPDCLDPKSAYGEGKRAAEMLCTLYNKQYQVPVKIARCFAFVGPYLPLDAHFAIGNFIRDGMRGGPIIINGDGTPSRSYLYPSDLIIWLLSIMILGSTNYTYNVGSDEDVTIYELAERVKRSFSKNIEIKKKVEPEIGIKPQRYVPSIDFTRRNLDINISIKLDLAIKKTIEFNNNLLRKDDGYEF